MRTTLLNEIPATLYDFLSLSEANIEHHIERRGPTPFYWMDIHVLQVGKVFEFASRFIQFPCLVRLERCPCDQAVSIVLYSKHEGEQVLTDLQDCAYLPGISERVGFKIEAAVLTTIRLTFTPQCPTIPPSVN